MERSINSVFASGVLSLYFFWVLFSGNALVFEWFPVALINLIFLYFFSVLYKRNNKIIDVKVIILALIIVLVFFMLNLLSEGNKVIYSYWPVFMFFSFLCVLQIRSLFELNTINLYWFILFFFLISSFLMVGASFQKVDGRGMFVFGPNILYRIFACSSILILLIGKNKKSKIKGVIIFFSISLYLMGIYITSSRGGLLLLPVLAMAASHLYFSKFNFKVLTLIFLVMLIPVFIIYMNFLLFIPEIRIFSLDITNNQRIVPLYFLFQNPSEVFGRFDFSYKYFLDNFVVYPGFQYPHNMFLEFFYYYEVVGLFFVVTLFTLFIKRSYQILNTKFSFACVMVYFTSILFIGSMFSGDLTDNYVCISLMLCITLTNKWKLIR